MAKEQVIKANQELHLLQRRSIKLEAQSRRNNTMFFNVKETKTINSFKETESVLKKLLVDQLKMPKEEVADLELREYTAFSHAEPWKTTLKSQ